MSIKVLNPGALTTVQDAGRYGFQKTGMLCCGVMDLDSYRTANRLLRNNSNDAVLEFTLFGGSYLFDSDTVIALSGADMNPVLDRHPCPMNRPVPVSAGSVLTLGAAATGCRTYLAVIGGIDVPVLSGSRSTNLKCRIGGYEGRALCRDDLLKTGSSGAKYDAACDRFTSQEAELLPVHPVYPSDVTVHVIDGPQADYFTEKGLRTFYSEPYILSSQSDRMGCRLNGPAIESIRGTDIVSDGIVFGSIQVTSDGQPIILMADRQTTGGYAKIATVCSFDLPVLAQCRPGNTVHFRKISVEEAQARHRRCS